ncbi:MAG: sulfite exporter TauE/SafE family protein [Acidobacteria bacterium]|nr:sulfite exporter TauE/SafE family protein [Acidobacteriota bacterium]
MEGGFFHSVFGAMIGLLDMPVGAALLDFLQSDVPRYTGELVSQFRWLMILVGLVNGFLVGLTGVGGGTLLTPLLILLGVRPTIAVGTDLFYASVTKIAGAQEHWRRGSIHWNWVFYLALGSVPSSLAATYLLQGIRQRIGSADEFVQVGLGVVLLVSAVITLLDEIYWKRRRKSGRQVPLDPCTHPAKVILLGAAVGFMVGLTSLGSGAVIAVALLILSGLPAAHIVGTDIAHGFFLLSAAALAHWHIGTVDIPLAANLLLGSLPGVILGSRLAYYAPGRPLKVGMSLLVLAGGFRMLGAL